MIVFVCVARGSLCICENNARILLGRVNQAKWEKWLIVVHVYEAATTATTATT